MGLLSDFIRGYARLAREWISFITNPLGYSIDQSTDGAATDAEQKANQQVERFFGQFFDSVEDDVVENVLDQGALTPENVEEFINEAEGAALEDALAAIFGLYGIETVSAGQLESGQFMVAQIMSFLALQDVLGRRTGMAYSKGVDPALEAEVAKKTRSEFVNLGDAVEYALRHKDRDEGWLRASGAPENVVEAVGSNEPVNPENLVEEWGIRDDNLRILEEVGLTVPEFEELIETPTEFGVLIDRDVVESVLDRSGYPEDLKAEFLKVADNVTQATTVYEERTAYEELINQLDEVMADEELAPDEARPLLTGLDDRIVEELVTRWTLIQEVPNTGPTRSLMENSFAAGYTDLDTLADRLDRLEYDTARYEDILRTTVRDDIDGTLQESFAVGLLSPGEYGELMDYVGLPDEAQEALMRGESLGDYTERALQGEAEPGDLPVESIGGIGSVRGSGLRAVGIETVGDLAAADPELVSEAAQVDLQAAAGYINAARLRTGQDPIPVPEPPSEDTTDQP